MEYRMLPRLGDKIGIIGMGTAVIGTQSQEEIVKTVRSALDQGINYFDLAGGHATIFEAFGKALAGRRQEALLQIHFGADYTSGEYGWTTELDQIKRSIAWQLEKLQTDYIDFGGLYQNSPKTKHRRGGCKSSRLGVVFVVKFMCEK